MTYLLTESAACFSRSILAMTAAVVLATLPPVAAAGDFDNSLADVQHRWAEANWADLEGGA